MATMTTFVASCLLCSMSPVDTHTHCHTHSCLYPFSLQFSPCLASPRFNFHIYLRVIFQQIFALLTHSSAVYDIGFSHFTFPISIPFTALPPPPPPSLHSFAYFAADSRCCLLLLSLSLLLLVLIAVSLLHSLFLSLYLFLWLAAKITRVFLC